MEQPLVVNIGVKYIYLNETKINKFVWMMNHLRKLNFPNGSSTLGDILSPRYITNI